MRLPAFRSLRFLVEVVPHMLTAHFKHTTFKRCSDIGSEPFWLPLILPQLHTSIYSKIWVSSKACTKNGGMRRSVEAEVEEVIPLSRDPTKVDQLIDAPSLFILLLFACLASCASFPRCVGTTGLTWHYWLSGRQWPTAALFSFRAAKNKRM